MQKMQMYINPTSFVTNIPKIGFRRKLACGQLNYALITTLLCCWAGISPRKEAGAEICVLVNFSTYEAKSWNIHPCSSLRRTVHTSVKFILIAVWHEELIVTSQIEPLGAVVDKWVVRVWWRSRHFSNGDDLRRLAIFMGGIRSASRYRSSKLSR